SRLSVPSTLFRGTGAVPTGFRSLASRPRNHDAPHGVAPRRDDAPARDYLGPGRPSGAGRRSGTRLPLGLIRHRGQQFRQLVVTLRGAMLHAGLEDHVANLRRRVEDCDGERGLASLLDPDGGYLRLTGVVIEGLHVD